MGTSKQKLPTAEQRQAVCDLMHEAFVELRYLPEEQAHDLAYAFHNLPKTMYGRGHWNIEGERGIHALSNKIQNQSGLRLCCCV